jgi:hypothetical protein
MVKKKKPSSTVGRIPAGLVLDDFVVDLPKVPNKPSGRLQDYFSVFFGEKSVGKTTLLNQFPGIHIWQLEPGRRNVSVLQTPVPPKTVEQMEADVDKYGIDKESYATPFKILKKQVDVAIEAEEYQVLAFDTLDRLYQLAVTDYCFMHGVADINQMNDYGTSHTLTDQLVEQFLLKAKLRKGVIGTSHGKARNILSDKGDQIDVKGMTAAPRMEQILRAMSDMQAYYGYTEDGERIFYVREMHFIKASCGIEDRFLSKGRMIGSFYAGPSAKDAYSRLNAAFNNKLKSDYIAEYVGSAPADAD